jgi:mRNA interferase RelE/StbE
MEIFEILETNPIPTEHFDIKKLKGFENVFRVMIGEYRLIYALIKEEKIIKVIKLEPRGKVYK